MKLIVIVIGLLLFTGCCSTRGNRENINPDDFQDYIPWWADTPASYVSVNLPPPKGRGF